MSNFDIDFSDDDSFNNVEEGFLNEENLRCSEHDSLSWTIELETALISDCDFGILRNICKARPVPDHLRSDVWKICLGVETHATSLGDFQDLFDLPEQNEIREDCQQLANTVAADMAEDAVQLTCDLESVLTHHCKESKHSYAKDNGWLNLLEALVRLRLDRYDLYGAFASLVTRYVPQCNHGNAFHVMRLLLLYHDPELCSYLDTRKVPPDLYARKWFMSMLANAVQPYVLPSLWDIYFQLADPFQIFFLALVILINAKEQLLELKDPAEIIASIAEIPAALEPEDVEDFCALAQHYSARTPESLRSSFHGCLFADEKPESSLLMSLCLPIQAGEVAAMASGSSESLDRQVRFLLVDCRSADEYNAGHAATAFHLNAGLMLTNPNEFGMAAAALLNSQRLALAAGSAAAGEHLCFIGTGSDSTHDEQKEDQLTMMVVAYFLQRNVQCVGLLWGGFSTLHQLLGSDGLADHNPDLCLYCIEQQKLASIRVNNNSSHSSGSHRISEVGAMSKEMDVGIFSKLRSKGWSWRERVAGLRRGDDKQRSENDVGGLLKSVNRRSTHRNHVAANDKVSKPYVNMGNVFSIDDEPDGLAEDFDRSLSTGMAAPLSYSFSPEAEEVSLLTWKSKPDFISYYSCRHVRGGGLLVPGFVLLTQSSLFMLRLAEGARGHSDQGIMCSILAKRQLRKVLKITSKKRMPELITFKYGGVDLNEQNIVDQDRAVIDEAGDATKAIKLQIMQVIESLAS